MIVPCFSPRSITFCHQFGGTLIDTEFLEERSSRWRDIKFGGGDAETSREMISSTDVFHKDDLSVCKTQTLRVARNSSIQLKVLSVKSQGPLCRFSLIQQQVFPGNSLEKGSMYGLTLMTLPPKQVDSTQQACAPRRQG